MDLTKHHGIFLRTVLKVIALFTVHIATLSTILCLLMSNAYADIDPYVQTQNTANQGYQAPEIEGIAAWLNSPPLTLAQLRGKVVLLDFWSYSCIYCVKTIPYLTNWDAKYRAQGLVIIGIHTPEYPFEANVDNVSNAVAHYGIQYPVALDNNFNMWSEYHNSFWPSTYLIDKNGNLVYSHTGVRNFGNIENDIQKLLAEQNSTTTQSDF